MTIESDILAAAVVPALEMLPAKMDGVPARVMLLAIGLQESRLEERRQRRNGPARGLWQFERGGGVVGVLTHPASRALATDICARRGAGVTPGEVYAQLEHDDILAAAFARLLLWTDPKPLPTDSANCWLLYLRTWRPGKPHPETWPDLYARAVEAVA